MLSIKPVHPLSQPICMTLTIAAAKGNTLFTFFELLEQYVKCGVFKYEITRILVELAQSFKQCVVVGIDQRQVLDVQHGDNILTVALVHGYPRVS